MINSQDDVGDACSNSPVKVISLEMRKHDVTDDSLAIQVRQDAFQAVANLDPDRPVRFGDH